MGQITSNTNLPYYDDRWLHYGFTIGVNTTRYKVEHSELFFQDNIFHSAIPKILPGFSLGFIVNFKVTDYLDYRMLPTVAFYERTIQYTYLDGTKEDQITESTFLELPLIFRYKSARRGNNRMYVVGGIKPGIEAGAKKREKREIDLRTWNTDLSIDYGFGIDIYYPLFKFSPEIRFSHGLRNLLIRDPNPFAQSLNSITTHTVSLYLHFE